MKEKQIISIDKLLKSVLVQLKLEEIGSWLVTHNTPLFYAHKKGFTIIDGKYIENHPELKKVLEKTVEDIENQKKKIFSKKRTENYFG